MKVEQISVARTGLVLGSFALASAASAQQTGNEWLSFSEDASRLVATQSLGADDTQEKDYAWGDLDQDGWTDLVVVRKQMGTSTGRRVNVLFMNENGVLTDRSTQYASASDVSGDEGFNTSTNDRDVVIVDVDMDGWDDVVTATTLSDGTPKHVSHPRVYLNLGNDAQGNWQGLLHEDARIPQLLLGNGQPSFPRFCGVDAGDVTGDGWPDLYFSDYDQGGSGGGDYNDRLLVNDGTGHFIDESNRMTTQMLQSDFGTNTQIVDLNGDGHNDIVKDSGLINQHVACSYNDPNNVGHFSLYQEPYNGAPYHATIGDVNNDTMPDLLVSDDASDAIQYNLGTDVFGRVNWSSRRTFQFASNQGDDGFGSDSYIIDLDDDGWNDIIIADVDVDIPGCSRRTHIYHNPGGAVGAQIRPVEEAQFTSSSGWKGVVGMTASDLRGTHDVATFDVDNDGDLDMVFGRCTGTEIWLSSLIEPLGDIYCPNVPNSTGLSGSIAATGSLDVSANDLTLSAGNLPQNQFGYFLTSLTPGFVALPGGAQGNLCLGGQIGRFVGQVQNSGSEGAFSISVDLTAIPVSPVAAVQPGDIWFYQAWFRDLNPGVTSNFTDGLTLQFQ
ncbi:MAG: VCBS repeat-containing protein [bacterium]|nr:VCBS repeat-containing protein [bacterium]